MDAKARQDCVKEIGLLKVSGLGQANLGWASSLGFYGSNTLGLSGQPTCSCPRLLPSHLHFDFRRATDRNSRLDLGPRPEAGRGGKCWVTVLMSSFSSCVPFTRDLTPTSLCVAIFYPMGLRGLCKLNRAGLGGGMSAL